jgi:hypothetical protein
MAFFLVAPVTCMSFVHTPSASLDMFGRTRRAVLTGRVPLVVRRLGESGLGLGDTGLVGEGEAEDFMEHLSEYMKL